MNLRTRLRRDCRLAHVDAYMNDPERFDEASDFAHDYFRDHPEATTEDCELAGTRAGLDPLTLSMLYALAYLAWTVFKAWRNRKQ